VNRTATKRRRGGPGKRSQASKPRRGSRRRLPLHRRRETWGWLAALAAVGGLVAVIFLGGGGGGSGSPDTPFVGGDLHSLVADPADPTRLFVGGHEGVAVSRDGGRTWRQVGSLDGADAMGWAFTEDAVLVGGHPGLFVSQDGGRTFEPRNEGLPATDVHALGAGGGIIYAASPQLGVFASTDGGRNWDVRTENVGQGFMGRIVVDSANPDHIIAPDMQNGAVESIDGGRTWRALGGVPGAMWVSWDPDDTAYVVVAAMGVAAETTNGGRTWHPLRVPAGASLVEMSPDDRGLLYAAALDGSTAVVWRSDDGGRSWTRP
jgi:photosystem II stability/assembly factor-like uncharacterized protein